MMTGMGQLAIEMQHSIKDVCSLNEQCFFGSTCSYKCNKYGLYGLSAFFFLVSIISLTCNLSIEFSWNPVIDSEVNFL